ncbi:hypothetical protein AKJ09_01763 [Labilithrix luteola]|uniref:Uncharacterized protein n=1 Tax=Labilithrix luteola TaxID=1391654 RepID=A0A0K1PPP9_9BACT|nr:hypothetical protein [Labilithrix luteola]AKU95099.1 hypothetical protein AKJ09_01763 [Labilithrix luteola]
MFHVAIGSYQLQLHYDRLPISYEHLKKQAQLVDEFDIWARSGAPTTNQVRFTAIKFTIDVMGARSTSPIRRDRGA